jgi:hypothetical protein
MNMTTVGSQAVIQMIDGIQSREPMVRSLAAEGDGFEPSVPRTISYRFGTGLEIIAKLAALRSR